MQGSGNVLVVGEAGADGSPRPISWEMLTAARQVASELGSGNVTGLFIGAGIADAARTWASGGADRVLIADGEGFAGLMPSTAAAALTRAIAAADPAVVLVPGTTAGRDYAPLVAARLGAGLAADCVSFAVEDGALVATRPVLGGRALTRITFPGGGPVMATVRSGSFAKAEPGLTEPVVEMLDVALTPEDQRVSLVETTPKGTGASRLDSAEVVVSGGRGLKEPAHFAMVEELGGGVRRGGRGNAGRCRCRMATAPRADRPDGKDGFTAPLRRRWHQRRGAAQRRDAGFGLHRGDQSRSGRADLQDRVVRNRRRSLRGRSRADYRGAQRQELTGTDTMSSEQAPRTELWDLPRDTWNRFLVTMRRALTRRCPYCGSPGIYDGYFALRERCPRCGVRFEREEGYFLGAYALNLIVAEFLGLGLAIVLDLQNGSARPPVDLAGSHRRGAGDRVPGSPLPVLTDRLDRDGPRLPPAWARFRAAAAGNADRARR